VFSPISNKITEKVTYFRYLGTYWISENKRWEGCEKIVNSPYLCAINKEITKTNV